eukprot:GSChrysophyteH1.ASY1.ANO1.3220.1 assembled CDS
MLLGLKRTSRLLVRCCVSFHAEKAWLSTTSDALGLESLLLTKSCVNRIKRLREQQKNESLKLRIQVDSGGCSGFQYVFNMEHYDDAPRTDNDDIDNNDGAHVVVDDASFQFIKGSTIDYEQELIRSAFAVINNPQSESACGCGSSFAVKNFSENSAAH